MSRFKVGDKVKIIGSLTEAGKAKIGQIGEILDIFFTNGAYFVMYPKGQAWVREADLALVTTKPSDPKREFLERLQSLLREFDASINIGWNEYFDSDKCPCIDMDITFGDGRGICFSNALGKTITADNIMDFDKE